MFAGNRQKRGRKSKQLALAAGSAAAVTAAAVLSAGATFGLFTATTAMQTNHFAAGTVTLSSDTTGHCNVSDILPGATPTPCTLKATYSGSAPGYLGLDVLIETQAGSGGTKLYNPSDSTHDLQITITDNQGSPVTYVVPTAATTCPGSAPGSSTCYGLNDELVNKTAFAGAPINSVVTFTTTVSVPASSTTGYQGGAAQIILTAHAAQGGHNGSTSSCTAGHECDTTSPGAGTPSWS